MTDINDRHTETVTASTTASVERVEGELRAFIQRDVSLHRTRRDNSDTISGMASLVERMAGASIQEIERVIAELANVRDMLRSEGTRLQGELSNYAATSQAAMDSMKIVGDSLVKWKSQGPKLSHAQQSVENPRRLPDNSDRKPL
jgi:cell wall assembly regulator SMI1